jgi:hypothetical protein
MDKVGSSFDSQIITKKAAQSKLEKSFVITIRQGTSKKEIFDLLRHYQVRKYKVTDIKISKLRPLDNSSPHLLDITFVKCDIGLNPSIIELPFSQPLATSTPKRLTSLNWSENASSISFDSDLQINFDSNIFSPQDILRDIPFDLSRTANFSLADFQPIRLFEAAQSTPQLTYLDVPLPSLYICCQMPWPTSAEMSSVASAPTKTLVLSQFSALPMHTLGLGYCPRMTKSSWCILLLWKSP